MSPWKNWCWLTNGWRWNEVIPSTARRLPGFRFEAQTPLPTEILPRMDVAVFIGFAAAGPLDTPVAVEAADQFTNIFGGDLPLAWDQERGGRVFAYLAPTVRAFFRNGGRRCWAIRVAGNARANVFPLPNLVRYAAGQLKPAFACARSAGSWSDSGRVGAACLSRFVQVRSMAGSSEAPLIDLTLTSPDEIVKGDLLRLTFRAEQGDQYLAMLPVKSIKPRGETTLSPPNSFANPASTGVNAQIQSRLALWFQPAWRRQPASRAAQIYTFASGVEQSPLTATIPLKDAASPLELDWPTSTGDQTVTLDLAVPFSAAPVPGSVVRVNFDSDELWLVVQAVNAGAEDGSPVGETVRVSGAGFWWDKIPPPSLPASLPLAEKITLEIWTREGNANLLRLGDLGFTPDHPRGWEKLPTDEQRYANSTNPLQRSSSPLWAAVTYPRFPLAGCGETTPETFFFPLILSATADQFLGPEPVTGTALERDGLATFGPELFFDPALIEPRTEGLLAEADFVRYSSPTPRRLRGIHAALDIEEATLIAVPDAVHRGWTLSTETTPIAPQPSAPQPRPEWWHFLDCDPPPTIEPVAEPQWGNFLDCGLRVIQPPQLFKNGEADPSGAFTLTWLSEYAPARYSLEESLSPDFADAVTIFTGTDNQFVAYGRAPGDYCYRVRVEVEGVSSDWSNGVVVRVSIGQVWQLVDKADYVPDVLIAVQWALLRLCAARGDLFAVLSAPEHYREEALLAHVARLKSPFAPPLAVGGRLIAPLGFGEARAFSYGALYHPWVNFSPEEQSTEFRPASPEGAVVGMMARRALARGAWIAPANEPLRGVVALTPAIERERWLALQTAQVNLLRQEPQGMLVLNADTLSNDSDLRLINVRRLLILLRRLALRQGAAYVFEPHDDAFQRLVRREFEVALGQLFARGAFAGRTPAAAFQVVVASRSQDIEQGRFILELRVAPSQPMTFLTIQLVQSGDRNVVVTEGR